jgi:hypothetical protein
MNAASLKKLVDEALAIETEDAKQADALGYMARVLVQATMPHRKLQEPVFERKNGSFSLAMMAHPSIGLPYGTYPRLLLAWLTTEAVRTKEPVLQLGPTLSSFMHELGLTPTGGRWGTIHSLKDRMERLFTCSISCSYHDENRGAGMGFRVAKAYDLWWAPKQPEQATLWNSSVTLSRDFFDEVIDRPVPIDIRALKALKRSPLALDIYTWLTYRMSYLNRRTEIPWAALQAQFGSGYKSDSQGIRDFKKNFLKQMRAVHVVYRIAMVEEGTNGLILKPSRTHVPKLIHK